MIFEKSLRKEVALSGFSQFLKNPFSNFSVTKEASEETC